MEQFSIEFHGLLLEKEKEIIWKQTEETNHLLDLLETLNDEYPAPEEKITTGYTLENLFKRETFTVPSTQTVHIIICKDNDLLKPEFKIDSGIIEIKPNGTIVYTSNLLPDMTILYEVKTDVEDVSKFQNALSYFSTSIDIFSYIEVLRQANLWNGHTYLSQLTSRSEFEAVATLVQFIKQQQQCTKDSFDTMLTLIEDVLENFDGNEDYRVLLLVMEHLLVYFAKEQQVDETFVTYLIGQIQTLYQRYGFNKPKEF